jgi:hypothetical protein
VGRTRPIAPFVSPRGARHDLELYEALIAVRSRPFFMPTLGDRERPQQLAPSNTRRFMASLELVDSALRLGRDRRRERIQFFTQRPQVDSSGRACHEVAFALPARAGGLRTRRQPGARDGSWIERLQSQDPGIRRALRTWPPDIIDHGRPETGLKG